jgi:erythromycin esterase-like protein
VLSAGYRKCEQAVVAQCRDLLKKRLQYSGQDGVRFLDAAQNARLIAAAERYYRIMYYGGAESWNLRDTHMFETLEHLLEAHGARSKAVVWAHNSHIGDARFTEMGAVRGELNIGQLCRERFGDQAASIGLGTHSGTVTAASGRRSRNQARAPVASRQLRADVSRRRRFQVFARPSAWRAPGTAAGADAAPARALYRGDLPA